MDKPNALKDPAHRSKVYKMLTSFVLMLICFTVAHRSMDLHWETRIQIASVVCGILYMMTALGFVFENFEDGQGKPENKQESI